MPRKSSGGRTRSQARNSKEFQRELRARQRAREREYNKQAREFEKRLAKEKRERDKQLTRILNESVNTGIYKPRSTELTPYRRKKLRGIEQQFGQYLDKHKYFFLPAAPKARKKILDRARNLEMQTTHTGLFFPREGHTSAKIKEDKRRGEFFIERKGKTKTGVNKGRHYKNIIPLATADDLDRERQRIREMADALGPLGDKDRIAFKIVENGQEGYSHATFSNIDLLLKYLDQYPKKVAAKVNFFRHIQVEKSSVSEWFRSHPSRPAGRKGRQRFDTRRSKG